MSITYVFNDLDSLADWVANKASEIRETKPRNKKDAEFIRGQAYGWAEVADVLRYSRIEPRERK